MDTFTQFLLQQKKDELQYMKNKLEDARQIRDKPMIAYFLEEIGKIEDHIQHIEKNSTFHIKHFSIVKSSKHVHFAEHPTIFLLDEIKN
jgi:penicillin V acylase-like amidase (Ntn superfamily)